MQSFKNFIKENLNLEAILKKLDEEHTQVEELDEDEVDLNLQEAKAKGPEEGKVGTNAKGVMHEILVGYHLNGGKHMAKHPNKKGESAKQVHDRLKPTIHPNDYKKMYARAKSAANDLRPHFEKNGHKIHSVHWTSKPGDLEASTGIKASQHEDPSDIVVTTHKK